MASSSRTEKRCLYEVLGIDKESSPDEIRSSYRRLALQRHPDKLIKAGGISESEATSQFQELVQAYEVLSDPKERAWYDSHRSQILFADNDSESKSRNVVPDLYAYFSSTVYFGYSNTGKGFYKVYFDVFNSVYLNEIKFAKTLGLRLDLIKEAPIMGDLDSPYTQVTAFYNYWLSFSTVMDFCWEDKYDAMAGPDRRNRRAMEEANKKIRKKAKREYNETVRSLAEFVKKRDKRVMNMIKKKNEEMEKKKEEEKERKRKIEKERLERAMNYEEPDWAKVEDEEEDSAVEEDGEKKEQLYCIVCSKKFKSEKQWKNHEQSKKHKEKVAELRETFSDFDEEEETLEEPETVEEMDEKFQEGLNIDDESDEEYFVAEEEVKELSESEDDEEMSVLKKMVSEKKNKQKNVVLEKEDEVLHVEVESDTDEEDNQKNTTARKIKSKKERKKRNARNDTTDDGKKEEDVIVMDSASGEVEDSSQKDESDSMQYNKTKTKGRRRRNKEEKDKNNLGGSVENKSSEGDVEESRSETVEDRSEYIEHKKAARSKKSTRGMKTKGTSRKNSSNECDRCGEEFESRTKLHKHIADTGHATVKSK